MPVMPEGPLRTAGTHDQVDRDAFDYTIWVRRDRCSAHSIRKLGAGFAEERLPEWAHLFTNSGNHKEIKLTTYLLRAGLRHR
jgi:hypothetical protein